MDESFQNFHKHSKTQAKTVFHRYGYWLEGNLNNSCRLEDKNDSNNLYRLEIEKQWQQSAQNSIHKSPIHDGDVKATGPNLYQQISFKKQIQTIWCAKPRDHFFAIFTLCLCVCVYFAKWDIRVLQKTKEKTPKKQRYALEVFWNDRFCCSLVFHHTCTSSTHQYRSCAFPF